MENSNKIVLREDQAFIKAVKEGNSKTIKSSYIDGVKTLALTLAANKSMETGKIEKVERI